MTTSTTLTVSGVGRVPVTFTDTGSGRPMLLLHGGAGPLSVSGFGAQLAADAARVVTPVHPGFDGTPRPDALASVASLAAVYGELLRDLGLTDVCVVGNSIGGWIAAELAIAESSASDPRITSVILVDAAGLQLDAAPIPDFFALTLDQVVDLSYADPAAFRIDPAALPAGRRAVLAANRSALEVYAGRAMADPSLLGRLAAIRIPTLVVWGVADRMTPVAHGRAYASAIPGARLRMIEKSGHLPQLEQPAELQAVVTEFASTHDATAELA